MPRPCAAIFCEYKTSSAANDSMLCCAGGSPFGSEICRLRIHRCWFRFQERVFEWVQKLYRAGVRCSTSRITPSLAIYEIEILYVMPRAHFPRFFSSDFIITTSPMWGMPRPPFFLQMYLSRSARRYSVVHLFHMTCLHRNIYL